MGLRCGTIHTLAHKHGVRAHVGAEIAVSSLGKRLTPPEWLPHQHAPEPARLPLLCTSRMGYQNLCQLITRFKLRETPSAKVRLRLEDLEQYSPGLVCLTGGDEGPLPAALMRGGEQESRESYRETCPDLREAECVYRASAAWRARGRVAQPSCYPYCPSFSFAVAGYQWRSL